ncbi:uncharacterized protein TNCV_851191 [Trichonephila clavipes]|nr:uncharacterized protein TNCV_851191 [Trichonephila clavipes]
MGLNYGMDMGWNFRVTPNTLLLFVRSRSSGIVVSDAGCGSAGHSRRAASPFERLVDGEEKWEAPGHPQGVLPQNWGGTEKNRTFTCMVLKAKTNDRRKNLALHCDEFRGL